MAAAAAAATAIEAAAPVARSAMAAANGQNIFVYTHFQTNQTIYSLTRSLWNKKAIKQMPFAGKKSVPSHIRKDLWQPLCVLSFPSATQGLDAYRKMREFKMLHETAWDKSTMMEKQGPQAGHQLNQRRERSRAIQDQKANAIADMAAVLAMQEKQPTEEEVKRAQWLNRRPIVKLHNGKTGPAPDRPKYGMGKRPTLGKIEWQGSVKGVKIHWNNVLDAEYAATWPADVLHGNLQVNRYTAVWPPPDSATESVRSVEQESPAQRATQDSPAQHEPAADGPGSSQWFNFGSKSA